MKFLSIVLIAFTTVSSAWAETDCSDALGRILFHHYTNGEHGGPGRMPGAPDETWSWKIEGDVVTDQNHPTGLTADFLGQRIQVSSSSSMYHSETTYAQKVHLKGSNVDVTTDLLCREFRDMLP